MAKKRTLTDVEESVPRTEFGQRNNKKAKKTLPTINGSGDKKITQTKHAIDDDGDGDGTEKIGRKKQKRLQAQTKKEQKKKQKTQLQEQSGAKQKADPTTALVETCKREVYQRFKWY